MAIRLTHTIEKTNGKGTQMVSPHVSDSEDGLEADDSWHISTQKLQEILEKKLQHCRSFVPRDTSTVHHSIKVNIHDVLESIILARNRQAESQPQLLEVTTLNQQSNTAKGNSLFVAQDIRRSSRRRNISFYQQHIYTIDSVSYILKIPLIDATELVKQRPEIIEMYRQNHLERYLKNGFKLPDKVPKKKGSEVVNNTSQEHHSSEAENEFSSVSSSESSTSESENESGSDSEPENNLPETKTVKFRGRIYKDLDAVSRASGLPKSYFSKCFTAPKMNKASHKRTISEQRIGVAKRKKGLGVPKESLGYDVFTADDDSQEKDTLQEERRTYDAFDGKSPAKDVIEVGSGSESHTGSTQDSGFLGDYNENDQYYNEENNDVVIVGEKDIQEHRNFDLSMFHPFNGDGNMFFRTVPTNLDNEAEVADYEIEPMLNSSTRRSSRKKNSRNTVSQLSAFGSNISSHRNKVSSRGGRISEKNSGARSLQRLPVARSTATINQSGKQSSAQVDGKMVQKAGKDTHPKKSRQSVFFIAPGPENLLPRNAGASTLVYEGLSENLSLVVHSNESLPNGRPSRNISLGLDSDPDFHVTTGQSFKASNIYKILFFGEKNRIKTEVIVSLGLKSYSFSKLLGDTVEKLSLFFKDLLDPSVMRTSWKLLIQTIDTVFSFCMGLDISEARSLLIIIDNFQHSVEISIRNKGHVKDIEFYYLSLCTLVFNICLKILDQNHIHAYDFQKKNTSTIDLFFEFACHVDGDTLSEKLQVPGYFAYSIEILSLRSNDGFRKVLNSMVVPDMRYIESLCEFTSMTGPIWNPIKNLFNVHLDEGNINLLREDIKYLFKFSTSYGWNLDDEIICLIFEAVKMNRFSNFPGEQSFPVIFSTLGLNKDTSVNIYLNLLMAYSYQSGNLTIKLLEKIIPVSKSTSMDITTFCNRVNILLCLAMVFEKSFESRIDELILDCDRKQNFILPKLLKTIEMSVKINQKNASTSKVKSLESVISSCLEAKDYDSIKHFFASLNSKSLRIETQRNILKTVSNFKNEKAVIDICEPLIHDFVLGIKRKEDFEFLKDHFANTNASLAPALWCYINGVLVSQDLANWSRLLNFNEFGDEPFFYAYILRHSGQSLYQIEKENFILTLLKNLAGRKYSSSLNSFIREVEKIDPELINSKGVLIQTHKFQICADVIANILQTEPVAATTRILSSLVRFIHAEVQVSLSNNDLHYRNFAKKIIQVVLANSTTEMQIPDITNIAAYFGIHDGIHNSRISGRPSISTTDILLSFERYLVDAVEKNKAVDATFFKGKLSTLSSLSPHDISRSSFYEICCMVSIHGEILRRVPQCWNFLPKISNSLAVILQHTRNISQMDVFCLAKTVKIFQFIFTHRDDNYQKEQYLTCISFIEILSSLFDVLEGTNDYFVIYDLSIGFVSRNPFLGNEEIEYDCSFLIKPPPAIYEMLTRLRLFSADSINFDTVREKFTNEYRKLSKRLAIFEADFLEEGCDLELEWHDSVI